MGFLVIFLLFSKMYYNTAYFNYFLFVWVSSAEIDSHIIIHRETVALLLNGDAAFGQQLVGS